MKIALISIRFFLAFLVTGLFLVSAQVGTAEAKDWKTGDGACPGTLDRHTMKCKRPYLCEPRRAMAAPTFIMRNASRVVLSSSGSVKEAASAGSNYLVVPPETCPRSRRTKQAQADISPRAAWASTTHSEWTPFTPPSNNSQPRAIRTSRLIARAVA